MGIARFILELKSRPRRVACAALVAVLVAGAMIAGVKQYAVGTASTRVLVDTPSSQIVAVNPAGVDLLSVRANLLASLMVSGPIKAAIAERAGLKPGQVYGIATSAPSPVTNASPPALAYVLTTSVLSDTAVTDPAGDELPIIDISTQGPNAADAAQLANAAVAGLQQYLDSEATSEGLPASQRIRITSVAAVQGVESVRGPSKVVAVLLALAVFLVSCALIVFVPRFKNRERRVVPSAAAIQEAEYRLAAAAAAAAAAGAAAAGVHEPVAVPQPEHGRAAQGFEQARAAGAGGSGARFDDGSGSWTDRAVREFDHGRREFDHGRGATPPPVRAVEPLPDLDQRPDPPADPGNLKPFSATLRAVRGSQESR